MGYMPFMEWLLTQRQHPTIGRFARWAWSEHSRLPRTDTRLNRVGTLLTYFEPGSRYGQWRETCKKAHKLYRAAKDAARTPESMAS